MRCYNLTLHIANINQIGYWKLVIMLLIFSC